MKYCPNCGKPLEYIVTQKQWYCTDCREYPFPPPPAPSLAPPRQDNVNHRCIVKDTLLNMLSGVALFMTFIIIIVYVLGIFMLNIGIDNFNYGNPNHDPLRTISRGGLNMVISICLLSVLKLLLDNSIDNKSWWCRLDREIGKGCVGSRMIKKIKRTITNLYLAVYGTVIFLGFIALVIGVCFVNFTEASLLPGISDIVLGTAFIIIGYQLYQKKMDGLASIIFPILDKQKIKEIKPINEKGGKDSIC